MESNTYNKSSIYAQKFLHQNESWIHHAEPLVMAAEVFFSPRHVLGLSHAGQWLRIYHGTHRKHYVLARDAYGRATLLRGRWWMNGHAGAIADGTSPSLPGRVNPEGSRRWRDALGYGRDALVASGFLPRNTQNGFADTEHTESIGRCKGSAFSVFSVPPEAVSVCSVVKTTGEVLYHR